MQGVSTACGTDKRLAGVCSSILGSIPSRYMYNLSWWIHAYAHIKGLPTGFCYSHPCLTLYNVVPMLRSGSSTPTYLGAVVQAERRSQDRWASTPDSILLPLTSVGGQQATQAKVSNQGNDSRLRVRTAGTREQE